MKVTYGSINLFMAGDMDSKGERDLLKTSPDLPSRILKVSHHGDRDSTSDEFLKSLSPEIAIISVGMANTYARPHKEVLQRLKRAGSRVYRTDMNGDIIMKIDGKGYTITSSH
jgi:competence protein ComEC